MSVNDFGQRVGKCRSSELIVNIVHCDPILWVLIPPITLPMIPTYFKKLYFAIRFNQVPSC